MTTDTSPDDLSARLLRAEGREGTWRVRLIALENAASAPHVVKTIRNEMDLLEQFPERQTGARAAQCRAFLKAVAEAGELRRKTSGR